MDTNLDQRPRRGPRGPYRRHTIEFKRVVVEQSLQPGASVSRLARLHDRNANQIFAWRKAYPEGRLGAAAFVRSSSPTPTLWTRPGCSMPQRPRSVG